MTTQVSKILRLVKKYPWQTSWFYAKKLRSNKSHYKNIAVITELTRMKNRGILKRKVKRYLFSSFLHKRFPVWKWHII